MFGIDHVYVVKIKILLKRASLHVFMCTCVNGRERWSFLSREQPHVIVMNASHDQKQENSTELNTETWHPFECMLMLLFICRRPWRRGSCGSEIWWSATPQMNNTKNIIEPSQRHNAGFTWLQISLLFHVQTVPRGCWWKSPKDLRDPFIPYRGLSRVCYRINIFLSNMLYWFITNFE